MEDGNIKILRPHTRNEGMDMAQTEDNEDVHQNISFKEWVPTLGNGSALESGVDAWRSGSGLEYGSTMPPPN